MFYVVRESCPYCGTYSGARILFGLSSGIGPNFYVCGNCKRVFVSGRREWSDMGKWYNLKDLGKLRYVAMSVLYAYLLTVYGGAFVDMALLYLQAGPDAKLTGSLLYRPPSVYGITIGLGIVALQIWRVALSRQRSSMNPSQEIVSSFWSIHSNLQILVALALLIPIGLSWIVSSYLYS